MKNEAPCPKCGETKSNAVHPSFLHSQTFLTAGFMSRVYITHYICEGCGFVEQYANASAKSGMSTSGEGKWNIPSDD